MDWKRKLERNAVAVVLTACVVTGSTVATVSNHFTSLRWKAKIADCKNQTASIKRTIGHDGYLDIRKVVVRRDTVGPLLNSQYFDDGEFYAPAASNGWTYQRTDEMSLARTMAKFDPEEMKFLQRMTMAASVYLWRSRKTLTVHGDPDFYNLFAFVYVERFSLAKMKRFIQNATSSSQKPIQCCDEGNFLDPIFRADAAGRMLTMTLYGHTTLMSKPPELLDVQKIRNAAYIAERMTLNNVNIDGVQYKHYFLYSEFIIVSDGPFITFVRTFVPSKDPLGDNDYLQYVSQWFAGLRILVG